MTRSTASKHIFVTGGVASSLGKGLTASSLGRLLTSRGLQVTMQKLDPYLNVDPDTMNPFQHGEVFVTEDGAETDLDVGHYERFLDRNLTGSANVTTGAVYSRVIARERRGDYQGATVQVIPQITDEIRDRRLPKTNAFQLDQLGPGTSHAATTSELKLGAQVTRTGPASTSSTTFPETDSPAVSVSNPVNFGLKSDEIAFSNTVPSAAVAFHP